MYRWNRIAILLSMTVLCAAADRKPPARPIEGRASLPSDVAAEARAAVGRGLEFLAAAQDTQGGWTPKYGPAITALVAKAFAQDPRYGPDHEIVRRATRYILTFRQKDGGLYTPQMNLANYQTAVAVMFLASLNDDRHAETIRAAQRFLTSLQYDVSEAIDLDNPWYGGAGYTETKRPDLSNTQLMLEALHESGLPSSDPVYQRALKFITRCQMLGATNDQPFAKEATDGGFIYTPADGGQSMASEEVGELTRRELRSYGSMTYAGFKSMLYAGLDRDDQRIRAAYEWIRRHYTLDANPNMPDRLSKQGLYYYYHVFARALHAWGEPTITDADGRVHHWRTDLCRKLVSLQNRDGSWANDADRWNEGDPNYVTAMAILSMQTALQP
jgi:squalene-hopene/tetraprenyl-beta-curcumene cyclase